MSCSLRDEPGCAPTLLEQLPRDDQLLDLRATVAILERLLATPSPLSPARLRVDPAYAPIASDVRFRRLAGEER